MTKTTTDAEPQIVSKEIQRVIEDSVSEAVEAIVDRLKSHSQDFAQQAFDTYLRAMAETAAMQETPAEIKSPHKELSSIAQPQLKIRNTATGKVVTVTNPKTGATTSFIKRNTVAPKETRSVPMAYRVTPTLKEAIDKAAFDEHRPTSAQIELILTEWLERRGYLAKGQP